MTMLVKVHRALFPYGNVLRWNDNAILTRLVSVCPSRLQDPFHKNKDVLLDV